MLNRNDDQNEAKKMVLFCVAAASMVLLLFLVVLYMHENKNTTKHVVKEEKKLAKEETEIEVGKSNLVSDDLDFWDMYDKDAKYAKELEEEEDVESVSNDSNKIRDLSNSMRSKSTSSKTKNTDEDEDMSESSMNSRNGKDRDEMDDGKHIKVMGEDGKAAWYEIIEDLKKNGYKFEDYLTSDNGLLKYNAPDIKSKAGIDVSGYQGSIEFDKVKTAGIDYVMLKVAQRGYETGIITIDDKFVEYATNATSAGLPIGLYVTTQAITDVEAVEEANFAVAASANYNVRYPIALDYTAVTNDTARTDKLTNKERTDIAKKFCETVKSYGKIPAICATRDFLISSLDLEDLTEYDIWLKDKAVTADYMVVDHIEDAEEENKSTSSNSTSSKSSSSEKKSKSSSSEREEEKPDYIGTDYPYKFSLWQYSNSGTINGINGSVNLDLSFVNYAER